MLETEPEQKLKLSTSNIIALVAVLLTLGGGYINIKDTQGAFEQRIRALEKADDDKKQGFEKFDVKLDRISESINQLKIDMASRKSLETKK